MLARVGDARQRTILRMATRVLGASCLALTGLTAQAYVMVGLHMKGPLPQVHGMHSADPCNTLPTLISVHAVLVRVSCWRVVLGRQQLAALKLH